MPIFIAAVLAAGAINSQTGLTAVQIFAKARLSMYLRATPAFITYAVDVRARAGDRRYREDYATSLRTSDDFVLVTRKPIYTTNIPENPYRMFGLGQAKHNISPPFGIPELAADDDFGLARAPSSQRTVPEPTETPLETPGPSVLARVTATAHDYDVTLVGVEQIDESSVYHLALVPERDPRRYRIRAVWIGVDDFQVRRLTTAGLYDTHADGNAMWTVDFGLFGSYWLVSTERTEASLTSPSMAGSRSATFSGISYTFYDYAFPKWIAEMLFFDRHIDTLAIQK